MGSRWILLVMLAALAGCSAPQPPRGAYSPPVNSPPALFPGVSTAGLSVAEQTKEAQTYDDQVVRPLLNKWVGCVTDNAVRLATISNEAAEVIARAALAACVGMGLDFKAARRRVIPYMVPREQVDEKSAEIERFLSDRTVLNLMKVRAAKTRGPSAPSPLPASPRPNFEQSI